MPCYASAAPQVVCVGEALFDLIADQKGLPRDKVQSWTPYAGGAPCNVATCLASLGVPTAFVSSLGQDERGQALVDLMLKKGVDVSGVQRVLQPTRDVYVTRDEDGDREFAGFGLPSEEYCDCFISSAHLPKNMLQNTKVLVTGSLGLAYPTTAEALNAAVAAVKAAGGLVLVDVNWRVVFWKDPETARDVIRKYMQEADVVKLSDADLEWLYGIGAEALQDPCGVLDRLGVGPKGVLVTAGDKGAAYCFQSPSGRLSGFVPVMEVDVVDTTGAGDAFTAGFVKELLAAGGLEGLTADDNALKAAVEYASVVGGLTCTRPGAIEGQPTAEEVEKLLAGGWG